MDPNYQPQPNPGSFMAAQGQPGQGSALMRLMQLRQMGATPQAGATPLPAAPVQTGSPVNMNAMHDASRMGSPAGGDVQPQPVQMPAGGGSMAPVQPGSAPQTTFDGSDPHLKIALEALANFVGNHGKKVEADSNVARKEAEAKVIASQAQPPASPVS